MKTRLENLSNLEIFLLLAVFSLGSLLGSGLINDNSIKPQAIQWWQGLLLNFGTELLGAIVTFWLIYGIVGQRDRRRQAIRRMGSQINDVALQAVEELGEQTWLRDGSLHEATLIKANLQKADLDGADLFKADLRGANLQNTKLNWANLKEVKLRRAILYRAEVTDEQLAEAWSLKEAIMPDGNEYNGEFDLPGDIGFVRHEAP